MDKFILKFNKIGTLRYISHLDLMRLFHRTFKRAGIKLKYSNGFNPHPKMVIAQPLSLGYESIAEYLEIETHDNFDPEIIKDLLNDLLPDGIKILECKGLSDFRKTLAAMVDYAEYEATVTFEEIENTETKFTELDKVNLDEFINQPFINVEKFQHKTNSTKLIEIKDLIKSVDFEISGKTLVIKTIICTGSTKNLNPDLLVKAVLNFIKLNNFEPQVKIMRNDIFFSKEDNLISLSNLV